jgi:hypothetical protein
LPISYVALPNSVIVTGLALRWRGAFRSAFERKI